LHLDLRVGRDAHNRGLVAGAEHLSEELRGGALLEVEAMADRA
jgi:hypothetical protein